MVSLLIILCCAAPAQASEVQKDKGDTGMVEVAKYIALGSLTLAFLNKATQQ